jgi:hypothetical protein
MLYSQPKKLPDGRYYLKVSKDNGDRCMLQLNNSTLLTSFSDGENLTLSLSEKGLEKINALNAENLSAARENSTSWFGKEVTERTLVTAYTPSVNGNTMITSKATINKNVVTKCYDHEKNTVSLDSLTEDTKCDVIVEVSGLWFMKKTFGPIWRLAQIRLKPPAKKTYPDQYLFNDSGSDEGANSEENDEDYI